MRARMLEIAGGADALAQAGLKQDAGTKEESYGTFDSSVYAWKSMRRKDRDFYFNDFPLTSWVYPALYRLSDAGLIDNINPNNYWKQNRPFTLYEVTSANTRQKFPQPS